MPRVLQSIGHNIYLGSDAWADLDELLKSKRYTSCRKFIMVDENTSKHCLPLLLSKTEELADAEIIETESGEKNKSLDICYQLWSALSELEADRKSLLINLGGGVICDMGGFVSATYKRGVDFINIPTTLLAQVDAAIGGKTGVDLKNIKNQVGLFAFPQAVFVMPEFLDTLPPAQLKSGFAEVVKHGLIADRNYWNLIHEIKKLRNGITEDVIFQSLKIKNNVVVEDPEEGFWRKILNFGHTIGHAFESYSLEHDRKPISHGEAVAAGMICEAFLSHRKLGLGRNELHDILCFILRMFDPYPVKKEAFPEFIRLMRNDKKNMKGEIRFTLLSRIGSSEVDKPCNEEEILAALAFYRLNTFQ
jgi:3-dehydroquinate synthase